MTRRALLIGAQTHGLTGVLHDVAAMAVALDRRGFTDIRACTGPDATRDGILAAYERLIATAGADDAVLVHYSGHGGRVHPLPGERDDVAAPHRQFIVPHDYRPPGAGEFRGIAAVELSVLLGRLTERTRNVVVTLDCCHSAMMSRDAGPARIRQIDTPRLAELDAHLRRLGRTLRLDLARPLGNRHAVRVVACAAGESAYEVPRRDGSGNYGLLTDALIRALDEAGGTRTTWSALIRRVRHLVALHRPHQRPEAEGPAGRMLFDVAEGGSPDSLPVCRTGAGRVRLDGAPLLGVRTGDGFVVLPSGATGPADGAALGTVRIDRCHPAAAEGDLRPAVRGAVLPPDARAHRTRAVAPRVPVRVPARLAPAVAAGTFVTVPAPGEPTPVEVVVAADGGLTVHDAVGPLHAPRRPGPAGDAAVVADLERIGRATGLRKIRDEAGWTSGVRVTLTWGRVRDGDAYPLPLSGAAVDVGDHIYLEVRNDDPAPLYVSLVDIGVSYTVALLTTFAPAGVLLEPGRSYVFGWDDVSRWLTGVPLTWPAGLDPGRRRPETVLVLITSAPQDVSVLAQDGVPRSGPPSPLGEVLAHFGAGATRDFGPPPAPADRHAVRSFAFDLVPKG